MKYCLPFLNVSSLALYGKEGSFINSFARCILAATAKQSFTTLRNEPGNSIYHPTGNNTFKDIKIDYIPIEINFFSENYFKKIAKKISYYLNNSFLYYE